MEADTPVDTDAGIAAPDMQLDDGVELLGKYKGSGLQESPYLLRRRDGQVVQVSRLLYLIAGCLDGTKHPEPEQRVPDEVAAKVSASFGQEVTPENVVYLVDKKLRPAGLIAEPGDEGGGRSAPRSNPLLALRLRLPVVPADAHRRVTQAFEPLFAPAWIVATLLGLLLADLWLVFDQWDNLSDGLRQIVFEPQLFLVMTGLIILAGAFHEIGHAAAARYGGAIPGRMGLGVYLVWPVFYTDLTDAYRLDRRGRLRTDLGGVYFNAVAMVAVGVAAAASGYRPLLVFLVILHVETARQFLPFVRLDGYYVVSDLAGVPNLFAYIQPVMVTLLRRGDPEAQRTARAKLDELNPRARRLVTGWVYLTAPVLAVNAVVFLFVAPRLAGAFWASAGLQLRAMTSGGGIPVVSFVDGLIALVLLALPFLGLSYVLVRLVSRLLRNMSTWWQARPLATASVSVAAVTLVALQVAVEWPDTFSDALKKAQVAQAINEPASDVVDDDLTALPPTPAAEGAMVPPSDAPSTDAETTDPPTTGADQTTTESSGTRTTTPPGSSSTTSKTTPRPVGSGASGDDSDESKASSTTSSSSTSTEAARPATPTTGPRPGTQDVPRGNPQAPASPPAPPRPPNTTTTTTRPPANLVEEILDILF